MRIKLGMPITTSEIAFSTNGLLRTENKTVSYITTCSSEVFEGDLFVALAGVHLNGEDYIQEAREKGGIILSTSKYADITVDDTYVALLSLAKDYKKRLPNLKYTVAITGSAGKTTTKNFLYFLLKNSYKTHATEENYNNRLGVALTLLSSPCDTEILITELGMNHEGEISELSEAVSPDIAVITNVGTAHIGNLGTRGQIAKEKLCVCCETVKHTVVPLDEQLLSDATNKYTVSLDNPNANAFLIPFFYGKSGYIFDFYSKNTRLIARKLNIPGEHNLTCLAYALTVCSLIGIKDFSNIEKISDMLLRQKRLFVGKYEIYDDTYSASPEATLAIMKLISELKIKRSAVLGDMLELGQETEAMHFKIGCAAKEYGFERLFLFGVYSGYIRDGAKRCGFVEKNIFINDDITRPELTARQIKDNYNGELLLFKGSHAVRLERIYKFLEK